MKKDNESQREGVRELEREPGAPTRRSKRWPRRRAARTLRAGGKEFRRRTRTSQPTSKEPSSEPADRIEANLKKLLAIHQKMDDDRRKAVAEWDALMRPILMKLPKNKWTDEALNNLDELKDLVKGSERQA